MWLNRNENETRPTPPFVHVLSVPDLTQATACKLSCFPLELISCRAHAGVITRPTELHYAQWETYLLTMAALTIAQQLNPQMPCILQIIQFRHPYTPVPSYPWWFTFNSSVMAGERPSCCFVILSPPQHPAQLRRSGLIGFPLVIFAPWRTHLLQWLQLCWVLTGLAGVVVVCEEKDCIPNAARLHLLAGFSEPSTWGQLLIGFQKVFIRRIYIFCFLSSFKRKLTQVFLCITEK